MAEDALDRGEPGVALEIIDEHSDVATYPDTLHATRGEAHLRLGQWGEAAVDLEAAGAVQGHPASDRADALRLASGAWRRAGQDEKALATFSRAEKLSSLEFSYPERLIEEGREIEHMLGELIAASVHGVLVTCLERDWDALQDDPQGFNFFFDKREKDFLEAADEIETLEEIIARGGSGQLAAAAPGLLYQILVIRGLNHAAGGDFEAARKDLVRASDLLDIAHEAKVNMALLTYWTYDPPSP
jgi:tetratricopeptide (TPR) repeat protein